MMHAELQKSPRFDSVCSLVIHTQYDTKDKGRNSDSAVPGVFSLECLVVGPVVFALHPLVDKHLLQLHLCSPQPSRQPQHGCRRPHPRLQVWEERGRLAEGGGGHFTPAGKDPEPEEIKKSWVHQAKELLCLYPSFIREEKCLHSVSVLKNEPWLCCQLPWWL